MVIEKRYWLEYVNIRYKNWQIIINYYYCTLHWDCIASFVDMSYSEKSERRNLMFSHKKFSFQNVAKW